VSEGIEQEASPTEEPQPVEPAVEPVVAPAAAPAAEQSALPAVEQTALPAAAAPAALPAAVAAEPAALDAVSVWPFVAYDLVWLAFASILVWQMMQLPAGVAVFDSGIYGLAVIGGITLTVAGPLLIIAVWVSSIGKGSASSGAVFLSALIRGAVATLLGVTLWWVALIVIDQLRLGRLL